MQILKSFGDGIGTAAGVAWPTFGLIFGTMGIISGGTTAIVLGSVLSVVFLIIAVLVTYWSYKNYIKETKHTAERLAEEKNKTPELVLRYALSLFSRVLLNSKTTSIDDFNKLMTLAKFRNKFDEELAKYEKEPEVQRLLLAITSTKIGGTIDFSYAFWELVSNRHIESNYELNMDFESSEAVRLKSQIQQLLEERQVFPAAKSRDYKGILVAALTGFFAAFGSIAGCAAGLYGLLSSVGIAISFAAFPLAGWIILGSAILFGVVVAGACADAARRRIEHNQESESYEKRNHALQEMTYDSQTKLHTDLEQARKKEQEPSVPEPLGTRKSRRRGVSADFYQERAITPKTLSPQVGESHHKQGVSEGLSFTSSNSFFNSRLSPVLETDNSSSSESETESLLKKSVGV